MGIIVRYKVTIVTLAAIVLNEAIGDLNFNLSLDQPLVIFSPEHLLSAYILVDFARSACWVLCAIVHTRKIM